MSVNCNNGKWIPFSENKKDVYHCFVSKHAKAEQLNIPADKPMAACVDKGKAHHTLHTDVEHIICIAAQKIHIASAKKQKQ